MGSAGGLTLERYDENDVTFFAYRRKKIKLALETVNII